MENTYTDLPKYIFISSNTIAGIMGAIYDEPYIIAACFLNFTAYIGYHIMNQRNQPTAEQRPLLQPNTQNHHYINLEELLELELSTPIEIKDSGLRKSDTSVNSSSQTPNIFPYAIKSIFNTNQNSEDENYPKTLTNC